MRKLAVIFSLPLLVAAVRLLPLSNLPSTCVFYSVTGLPCPTCGMTRAVIALTRFDLQRAAYFHPLAVVFGAAVTVLWGLMVYEVATGRSTASMAWIRRRALMLVGSVFGLLAVYGAVRIAILR